MRLNFRLFRRRYTIAITRRYCGAQTSALRPLPGEDWLRGRDLRDGRLIALPLVLADVIACEFGLGKHGAYL